MIKIFEDDYLSTACVSQDKEKRNWVKRMNHSS